MLCQNYGYGYKALTSQPPASVVRYSLLGTKDRYISSICNKYFIRVLRNLFPQVIRENMVHLNNRQHIGPVQETMVILYLSSGTTYRSRLQGTMVILYLCSGTTYRSRLQGTMVNPYRRLGTTYRSRLQGATVIPYRCLDTSYRFRPRDNGNSLPTFRDNISVPSSSV